MQTGERKASADSQKLPFVCYFLCEPLATTITIIIITTTTTSATGPEPLRDRKHFTARNSSTGKNERLKLLQRKKWDAKKDERKMTDQIGGQVNESPPPPSSSSLAAAMAVNEWRLKQQQHLTVKVCCCLRAKKPK